LSRYVLSVVYRDGVPREILRFDRLSNALDARDRHRDPARRLSEHWMVHDSDDEERGELEWPEAA
jgi:hypothetical protein